MIDINSIPPVPDSLLYGDRIRQHYSKKNEESKQVRHQAATLIQKVWKRSNVERKFLSPSKLIAPLKKTLTHLCPNEIDDLSKIISRQTVHLIDHPKEYTGQGVRINKETHETFHDTSRSQTKNVKSPITFWIQLSDDRKSLKLQFYSKKKIGKGSYKAIKRSNTLIAQISQANQRNFRELDTVLVRSNKVSPDEKASLSTEERKKLEMENIGNLLTTMDFASNIFSDNELRKDPRIHLKKIPKTIRTHTGKCGETRLEWEETRYIGGDFERLIDREFVELSGGKRVNLKLSDKLRICNDILYTCRKMHNKGVVHRDVNASNVFIDVDSKIEGYLGDFDLISPIGESEIRSPYPHWDLCSANGLVLPTTDLFGIILMLAESVFGKVASKISLLRFYPKFCDNLKDSLFLMVKKTIIEQFKKNSSSFNDQHNMQRILRSLMGINTICELETYLANEMDAVTFSESDDTLRLISELATYASIGQLLNLMFDADSKLYNMLRAPAHRDIYTQIASGDMPEKKKALEKLYSKVPIFQELEAHLSSIKEGISM